MQNILFNFNASFRIVFLGIDGSRCCVQNTIYAICKCNPQIGGIVYFAHTTLDTLLSSIIRNPGSSMQHKRDFNYLADFAQAFKIELGDALIHAMRCANCNSKAIHLSWLNKTSRFLRIGIRITFTAIEIIVFAADLSKFRLDGNEIWMAGADNALCQFYVFIKCIVRTINHNRGVSRAHGLHCEFKTITVIQIHNDRHMGAFCRSTNIGVKIIAICIFYSRRRGLQNDGRVRFSAADTTA